jgi:hypothetical protein
LGTADGVLTLVASVLADGTFGRGMQWQGMSLRMTLLHEPTPKIPSNSMPTPVGPARGRVQLTMVKLLRRAQFLGRDSEQFVP